MVPIPNANVRATVIHSAGTRARERTPILKSRKNDISDLRCISSPVSCWGAAAESLRAARSIYSRSGTGKIDRGPIFFDSYAVPSVFNGQLWISSKAGAAPNTFQHGGTQRYAGYRLQPSSIKTEGRPFAWGAASPVESTSRQTKVPGDWSSSPRRQTGERFAEQ